MLTSLQEIFESANMQVNEPKQVTFNTIETIEIIEPINPSLKNHNLVLGWKFISRETSTNNHKKW
jgi:hypothetical protein